MGRPIRYAIVENVVLDFVDAAPHLKEFSKLLRKKILTHIGTALADNLIGSKRRVTSCHGSVKA